MSESTSWLSDAAAAVEIGLMSGLCRAGAGEIAWIAEGTDAKATAVNGSALVRILPVQPSTLSATEAPAKLGGQHRERARRQQGNRWKRGLLQSTLRHSGEECVRTSGVHARRSSTDSQAEVGPRPTLLHPTCHSQALSGPKIIGIDEKRNATEQAACQRR